MKLSLMFEMTYIVISYRFSIARCENTINLGTTVWAVQTLGLNFLPVTEKAWHLYFHTAFISCAALIFGPKEKRKGKGLLLSSPALHGGFLIIKRNFCKLIFLQIATLPKACVPQRDREICMNIMIVLSEIHGNLMSRPRLARVS